MTRLKFYALTGLGYFLTLAALGLFASVGVVVLGLLFCIGLVLGLVAFATSFAGANRHQRTT